MTRSTGPKVVRDDKQPADMPPDLRECAITYLAQHYDGLYLVTRQRDYPDGSRLYGSSLWVPPGPGVPMVYCRVAADGTIHGTPEHARARRASS